MLKCTASDRQRLVRKPAAGTRASLRLVGLVWSGARFSTLTTQLTYYSTEGSWRVVGVGARCAFGYACHN